MTEFTPPGSNPHMTQAQVRKYVKNMKQVQEAAKQKLAEAEANGDLETSPEELAKLEQALEDEFNT
ncbi:hypothetical protein MK079_02500 [Candidatus Gracilibacteria bacterium]|nr:hypothetical protein [Candidatus Gracilibacteria bacterium]